MKFMIIENHKFLQIGRDQGFSKTSDIKNGNLSYKETSIIKLKSHIDKNKYLYGGMAILVIAGLITLIF